MTVDQSMVVHVYARIHSSSPCISPQRDAQRGGFLDSVKMEVCPPHSPPYPPKSTSVSPLIRCTSIFTAARAQKILSDAELLPPSLASAANSALYWLRSDWVATRRLCQGASKSSHQCPRPKHCLYRVVCNIWSLRATSSWSCSPYLAHLSLHHNDISPPHTPLLHLARVIRPHQTLSATPAYEARLGLGSCLRLRTILVSALHTLHSHPFPPATCSSI